MPILFNPNKKKGVFMIPSGGTQAISCAFSYSAASYTDADPDPTPTVTGTSGGTFTSTAGIVINADTGEIDLSASTLNTYVVTYTVGAKACTQSVEITASFSNTKSLAFDGVDDYVDCGNDSSLQFSGSFSISLWAKLDGSGSNALISKDSHGGAGNGYHIDFRSGSEVHAWAYKAVDKLTVTGLTTDTWYNIVFVFESTGGANGNQYLYIDGSEESNNSITSFVASTTKDLRIGASEMVVGFETDGNIDEVAIWDVALASTEVTELYTNGPIALNTDTGNYTSSSDLQAWWRMGDKVTSFPTIPDQAGSNDGTATNMDISDIETDVPT